MNKLFTIALGLVTALTFGTAAQAKGHGYSHHQGVCCSEQMEVEITPFALVEGARQGQFKSQGIPSYAVFSMQVRSGQITAEDLVQAAYMEYRATFNDISGQSDLVDRVDSYLDIYRQGR